MIKLLVIADDLTGAMDTGVQFAGKGIKTLVTMDLEVSSADMETDISVLVVNTESRHLPGQEAYERVYRVSRSAKTAGVSFVLKKTDSTLRGNIGNELQAVMDAWEATDLMFIPAYPANGRTTVEGRQYVYGLSLEQSAFAKDPLEPMRSGDIREIIRHQCMYSTTRQSLDDIDGIVSAEETIHIFDSGTQDELCQIVQRLKDRRRLQVTAGCAGLASAMADIMEFETQAPSHEMISGRMLVICGSLNTVTQAQVSHAAEQDFAMIRLTPEEKLGTAWNSECIPDNRFADVGSLLDAGRDVVLATVFEAEDVAACDRLAEHRGIAKAELPAIIAGSMARIVVEILRKRDRILLVVFGGDTAIAIVNQLGVHTLTPCREILPGIVLSKLEIGSKMIWLVTKAGGFGDKDILMKIRESRIPNR